MNETSNLIQWRCYSWVIAVFIIAGCSSAGEAQPQIEPFGPPDGAFGVLFVGNSLTYTNDLPGILGRMLTDADIGPVAVASRSFPNFGLQDHWVNANTLSAVAGGWDVVIMQQGPSATEGRPSLLEYSELFANEIRVLGGTPGLYMVWPSSTREFDFDGVSDSYATAAEQVDGYLFPAGEAWRIAWEADASLPLYGPDGFHPSPVGTYLAALVMYEQLSGQSLSSLPVDTPVSLGLFDADSSVVALLHEAAAEANVRFARGN